MTLKDIKAPSLGPGVATAFDRAAILDLSGSRGPSPDNCTRVVVLSPA